MSLSPAFLDELRARTSLSALIGRSVKLTKAGREYKACCPFHNERTPSFYVNDDKHFYHCFGCQAHGDAIRFLTDAKGLTFMDAVKELADAAGMDVPAPDPRARERQEQQAGLHDVMAAAQRWFAEQLDGIEGANARSYLKDRGITAESIKRFGIGFAPDSRGKLKDALKSFGNPMLIECGLLIQPEDEKREPYDRFRGRLMIPIRDPRGRVIAFGGRILGAGEPKYLNSPDTPLFDKGRTLYNLDLAAPAARKAGRIIVVEGYMDVIALAQAGIEEAVAPLGTALTEHQLALLWRQDSRPLLCFDGDKAGIRAARKAAARALPLLQPGQTLAFVPLPDGQDPDDVVRTEGRLPFLTRLDAAKPLQQLLWDAAYEDADRSSPEGRASILANLRELAKTIEDSTIRALYDQDFRELFWREFGWRRDTVQRVAELQSESKQAATLNLMADYHRAMLLGFCRYQDVLLETFEQAIKLPLGKADAEWLQDILDEALARPEMTDDHIQQMLDSHRVSERQKRDLRTDLAYSFYYSEGPERGQRDLRELVFLLAAEQEVAQANLISQGAFRQNVEGDSWHEHLQKGGEADRVLTQLKEWGERTRRADIDGVDADEPIAMSKRSA